MHLMYKGHLKTLKVALTVVKRKMQKKTEKKR